MTQAARMKALRDKRAAAGQCVGCGIPAVSGRARCDECARRLSEAQKRYRDGVKLEEEERIVVQRAVTPILGLPIDAAALRSCPICGSDDIVAIAQYGEDRLPSCASCAEDGDEEVGYPLEMSVTARAVLVARTCQGMTRGEIAEHLGMVGKEKADVFHALRHALERGFVRTVNDGGRIEFYASGDWIVSTRYMARGAA